MLPKHGVSGVSRQIWITCILSSWSLMSSCHSLSGDFCSEKRNLAVSLTAPECFQEITPTWLSAVLHLLPCRNLYFCPPWPPGNCSCSNYSCLLFLSFLTLKVPFVYPPCPQLLFSVTGNPLTACPGVPCYLCYCNIWLPAATF